MSDVLKPGQSFATRYRIEKFLAKGGFGAVYIAEQIETELRVALKILWPHVLFSEDAVSKFKLEARIAGRVGSEHIVRVFDSGFDEETRMPFLVMELLAGEELQRKVEREGPLPAEKVVAYMRQITSALDKAHGYVDREGARSPIVHRDLKPENLFLATRESGDPIVKILDFGIAKILSDSTQMSRDVKGTPLYMAFEQAGAGEITPQTDIWPLGLIGFFLLTGHCYWKAGNAENASLTQLFGEVLSLPIDPPSQRAREIGARLIPPRDFDAWFARCVNREASARFKTAGECANALAAALTGAPDTRPSAGLGIPVAGSAAFAGQPNTGSVAGTSSATVEPDPTQRAAEQRPVATTAESIALGQTKAPETPGRGSILVGLGIAAAFLVGGVLTAVAMKDRGAVDPGGSASAHAGGGGPPPESSNALATAAPSAVTSSAPPVPSSSPPVASATPDPVERPTQPAGAGGRKGVHVALKQTGGAAAKPPPPPPTTTPKDKRTPGVYDDR